MKTPHKHAELIKLWADGAEIECRFDEFDSWIVVCPPHWNPDYEYRIKSESKPDVVQFHRIEVDERDYGVAGSQSKFHNIRLTFDGETGALKAAELLK